MSSISEATSRLGGGKKATRPTTWFSNSNSNSNNHQGSTSGSSLASTSISSTNNHGSSGSRDGHNLNPFAPSTAAPISTHTSTSFRSQAPSSSFGSLGALQGTPTAHPSANKHKLSPSPSPRHPYPHGVSASLNQDDDFVMISPLRPALASLSANTSSPSSPTPCVATAAAKLNLADDSPIRRVPGQSRSLAAARSLPLPNPTESQSLTLGSDDSSPPPTPTLPSLPSAPLFPTLRSSQSQDCNTHKIARVDENARASGSRARSSTDAGLVLGKKAVSLDHIPGIDEPFGSPVIKKRPSKAHRRVGSTELSRSIGHRSGLTLSPALPDLASNSSLSSISSSTFSPAFDDVKPNPEAFAFATAAGVKQKFKPRDSGVSMETSGLSSASNTAASTNMPPPSVLKIRPPSVGAPPPPREIETPSIAPSIQGTWPGPQAFDFLGEDISGLVGGQTDSKPSMPGTPVKKHSFGQRSSTSQPNLSATITATVKKPTTAVAAAIPEVNVTSSSSPSSVDSPTVHLGTQPRVGLLSRLSNNAGSSTDCSEDEGTPTKGGGERTILARDGQVHHQSQRSPTMSRKNIMPRLSLPVFAAVPKTHHKTLHHRQSHPAPATQVDQDIFEQRFITLDTLGKGAFSTVLKVQDRMSDELYAVKKARGVFDGVKHRLRHLEEVDILRHLSHPSSPHVIRFVDAWEQDRQLFIQTELCLGSLAFFLEEYGRVVERLDEGRVWKIVRELSDGINHIHSSGVIHFDIKPANILISPSGSLKIADFGLATRFPRVSPMDVIKGSGLGGTAPPICSTSTRLNDEGNHATTSTRRGNNVEKLEREGDRVYMPPEMLRGIFVMAADIFSFGLVILEVSTNICVPDGGAPWHALREDDFSVVDLSPLSPALTDLIVKCMASEPSRRPRIEDVVGHPVVQRARAGKEALAPEDPRWLADVLAGNFASTMMGDGGGGGRTVGIMSPVTESTPLDDDVVMGD